MWAGVRRLPANAMLFCVRDWSVCRSGCLRGAWNQPPAPDVQLTGVGPVCCAEEDSEVLTGSVDKCEGVTQLCLPWAEKDGPWQDVRSLPS